MENNHILLNLYPETMLFKYHGHAIKGHGLNSLHCCSTALYIFTNYTINSWHSRGRRPSFFNDFNADPKMGTHLHLVQRFTVGVRDVPDSQKKPHWRWYRMFFQTRPIHPHGAPTQALHYISLRTNWLTLRINIHSIWS